MKQLLKATIMFIASLALFTAVVYAWFSNSNYSNIQPMNAQTIERNLDMDIEFGINGGGYSSFDNPADINAYLSAMKAGDLINIRVVILNSNSLASPDLDLSIMLFNIRASETSALYDLTDYFYLENGTINLTWYQNINEYYAENPYSTQSILIDQINEAQVDYIGVPLQSYRLSNIFNHYMDGEDMIIENNIDVLETTIASQELIIVEFSLGLDAYAPDDEIGIQNGELLIDGLYTFFEE
jgi:hypothetical protein